jgi:hypothetical protein
MTELEKLRKLLEAMRQYATGTAYLTPKRIQELLIKLGLDG